MEGRYKDGRCHEDITAPFVLGSEVEQGRKSSWHPARSRKNCMEGRFL